MIFVLTISILIFCSSSLVSLVSHKYLISNIKSIVARGQLEFWENYRACLCEKYVLQNLVNSSLLCDSLGKLLSWASHLKYLCHFIIQKTLILQLWLKLCIKISPVLLCRVKKNFLSVVSIGKTRIEFNVVYELW